MIFELLLLHVLLTTSMTNILLVYFCMHKLLCVLNVCVAFGVREELK